MSHVPDQPIFWRVECVVQGHGQFDRTEAGPEVSLRSGPRPESGIREVHLQPQGDPRGPAHANQPGFQSSIEKGNRPRSVILALIVIVHEVHGFCGRLAALLLHNLIDPLLRLIQTLAQGAH